MERRDFIALWIQALLLAIFPWLRSQPEFAEKLTAELSFRALHAELLAAKSCPLYNMPVITQVRWTLNEPLTDAEVEKTFGDEMDLFRARQT